jgi:plastocyanin
MGRAARYVLLFSLVLTLRGVAQRAEATFRVHVLGPDSLLTGDTPVVAWLSPLNTAAVPARATRTFKMDQQNKQFRPHLLVVPVGSTVEFPNLDPFFHNVFSLFNGRRFDLGLYETGQSQAVKLPREGISYIFCNIHPEMGGVILSLATPYYASSSSRDIVIRGIPPGSYRLSVWNEHATAESLSAAARVVTVAADLTDPSTVTLAMAPRGAQTHPNKYGEQYPLWKP